MSLTGLFPTMGENELGYKAPKLFTMVPQAWIGGQSKECCRQCIDGFQMSSILLLEGKRALKRQLCSKLSPWEKQLLLSLSTNGKDATQCLLACTMHTDALNTDPDSCPLEVKPHPMKTIYKAVLLLYYLWVSYHREEEVYYLLWYLSHDFSQQLVRFWSVTFSKTMMALQG